jgi:hypothetical protein
VATCIIAILVGLAEDEHLIARSRSLHRTCWAFAILGGLFAIAHLGIFFVDRARTGSRLRVALAGGFFFALFFGAFATYSLGFHWKETRSLCWEGSSATTLEARRRATAEGSSRARSIFNLLPDLVFGVSATCDDAERQLLMIERGECPYQPLPGVTCRCGAELLPRDARCTNPQCVPLAQPRTRCWGDSW